jgi:hypothetical protein
MGYFFADSNPSHAVGFKQDYQQARALWQVSEELQAV